MSKTEKSSPFSLPQAPFLPKEAQSAYLALAEIQGEAVKAALRYQIETLAFLQRRFEKDVRFVDALAASQEHGDTYDVCVDFWREAFSDYSNEAGRLVRIESKAAADAARTIERESRAFAEELATRTAA